MEFDLGKWFGKSFNSTFEFKDLYNYVSSRTGYNEYVKSEKKYWTVDNEGKTVEFKFDDEFAKKITEIGYLNINKTSKFLLNMLIVYQSSILEGIIKDCFKVIFLNDPVKLKFMNTKKDLEYSINLDTILKSKSKEDLIELIAEDNAGICSSGKVKTVLRRLNELTGKKLDLEVLSRIENIIVRRNEIIHELKELNIGIIEIETIHRRITDFLIDVSKYFISIGICVYDPASILPNEKCK